MTTLQITLDETVAAAIKAKAEQAGKTPEVWAAEVVAAEAAPPDAPNNHWIVKFLESARKTSGNSRGWKWNREELYDR